MKFKLTATVLLIAGLLPSSAWAGTDVAFDDLPPVVQKTIEREVKTGTIEDIEWEADARVPHYDVEYSLDGVEWELDVAPDGRVLRHEQD